VVADGALGKRPTAREALQTAGRRFWPLARFSLLLGLLQLVLVLVLAAAVTGLVVAFSGVANSIGIVYAVLIAIPIALALVVVYGFFAVKLALAPTVIVLEKRPVLDAIRRSWSLTRRAFWRTFGLMALVTVMVSAAAQIVSLPFTVIGGALGGLLFPNAGGGVPSDIAQSFFTSLPSLLVVVVVAGIGQIAQVGVIVLVYLDRRMRIEGLDLELRRFAEQGGDDPYERVG
jgi:membrane-anchored glycerophosphoryl diester phosphodiesterase (GDPDase)